VANEASEAIPDVQGIDRNASKALAHRTWDQFYIGISQNWTSVYILDSTADRYFGEAQDQSAAGFSLRGVIQL
jgi:hypothetical protein